MRKGRRVVAALSRLEDRACPSRDNPVLKPIVPGFVPSGWQKFMGAVDLSKAGRIPRQPAGRLWKRPELSSSLLCWGCTLSSRW